MLFNYISGIFFFQNALVFFTPKYHGFWLTDEFDFFFNLTFNQLYQHLEQNSNKLFFYYLLFRLDFGFVIDYFPINYILLNVLLKQCRQIRENSLIFLIENLSFIESYSDFIKIEKLEKKDNRIHTVYIYLTKLIRT